MFPRTLTKFVILPLLSRKINCVFLKLWAEDMGKRIFNVSKREEWSTKSMNGVINSNESCAYTSDIKNYFFSNILV